MEKNISNRQINETSAGIIFARNVDGEYVFLLLRSYNFWNAPKGHVESGETTLDAAIREVKEEAAIDKVDINFKWDKESYTTEPFKKGHKIDIFFVAETTKKDITMPINPELGHPEHEEYRWVTYEEGLKLTNERIGKALTWAYNKIKGT